MSLLGKLWRFVHAGGSTSKKQIEKSISQPRDGSSPDTTKEDKIRKAFTFNGKAIIRYKPNAEGEYMQSKELEVFVHPSGNWIDARDDTGKLISIPREEIFEIEWIEQPNAPTKEDK